MNYLKHYLNYMNYVKTLHRKKLKLDDPNYVYYEEHHIKPKSIYPELEKDPSNLVLLTAREHFLAHYALCKIYKDDTIKYFKMLCAFNRMIKNTSKVKKFKYVNSRLYEKLRTELNIRRSEFTRQQWKRRSEAEKQKIKDKIIQGRRDSNGEIHISEEQKRDISNTLKQYYKEHPEFRQYLSEINKGKKHTKETKNKMSKSHMGHSVSEETRIKLKQQHGPGKKVKNSSGESFPSLLYAEKLTGIRRYKIRQLILTKNKDENGNYWYYE